MKNKQYSITFRTLKKYCGHKQSKSIPIRCKLHKEPYRYRYEELKHIFCREKLCSVLKKCRGVNYVKKRTKD